MVSKLKSRFHGNKNFWLGIIGSLLIFLLVIGSTLFKEAGIGEKTIDAEFEQAAGMTAGQKIRVAGIEVGQVKDLKLDGNRVLATFSIEKGLELGADATAEIKMATILGTQYVALDPGNPDNGKLEGRLLNTKVPFSLAKVVNESDPRYENQFDRLEQIDTKQLAQSLEVLNQQFSDPAACPEEVNADNPPDEPALCAKLISQSLDSVGVLAGIISERKDQFDALLKNLDQVSTVLSDNRNGVLVVITQGQQIAERVMQRQTLIRELLNNVATLSGQLEEMGLENDNQLGGLIQQLNTLSEGLDKNRDQLARLLQIFPVTARQANNAFGDGNYVNASTGWLFPDNWLCFAHVIEGCQG